MYNNFYNYGKYKQGQERMAIFYAVKGSLLEAPADFVINTVNCVGVMGKGVALRFGNTYPEMKFEYKKLCSSGALRPGTVQLWYDQALDRHIVNFPTKNHWRENSTLELIKLSAEALSVEIGNIHSQTRDPEETVTIAMPHAGCGNGGLDWTTQVFPVLRAAWRDSNYSVLTFRVPF